MKLTNFLICVFVCCCIHNKLSAVNNIGIFDSEANNSNSKFRFYLQQQQIFKSDPATAYNMSVRLSKLSADGRKVVICGQDNVTKCDRILLLSKDGSGIEEIDLSIMACKGSSLVKYIDMNYDGTVIYWTDSEYNGKKVYKHENGTTGIFFNIDNNKDDNLNYLHQMICSYSGQDIFIRDGESGVFKINKGDASTVEHIINSENLGTAEKYPNRFDIPISLANNGAYVIFGITSYHLNNSGSNVSAKELWIKQDNEFKQIAESANTPITISEDGGLVVYTNIENKLVSKNLKTNIGPIELVNRFKSTSQMSLSFDGSKLINNANYLANTDGSVGVQINNLSNASLFYLNDSATIAGFQCGYPDRYYFAYLNTMDSIPDAPVVNDIFFTVVERGDNQSKIKLMATVSDPEGLSDIEIFNCWRIEKETGCPGTIITIRDIGRDGDEVANDGKYSGIFIFNNYDTLYYRVQVSDKAGNITIADKKLVIDPNTLEQYQVSPNFALVEQGTVDVEIEGSGFHSGTTVKFHKDDGYTINPKEVQVIDKEHLTATLDLNNMYVGEYDILISNSASETMYLDNSFRLQDVAAIPFGEWVPFKATHGNAYFSAVEVPELDQLFTFVKKSTRTGYASTWTGKMRVIYDGKDVAQSGDFGTAGSVIGGTFSDMAAEVVNPEAGYYTFEIDNLRADIEGEGEVMFTDKPPLLEFNQWEKGEILRPYGADWKTIVVPEGTDTLFIQTEGLGVWSTLDVYYESIMQKSNHWQFLNWGKGHEIKGFIVNPKAGTYYIRYMDSAVLQNDGNSSLYSHTNDQTREYLIYAGIEENPMQPNKPITIRKLSETKFGNTIVTIKAEGINLHLIDDIKVIDSDNRTLQADTFGIDSSDYSFYANFDFSSAKLGDAKIKFVSNKYDTIVTREIKIEEKSESNLVVEVIGREQLRIGRNQTYVIRVTNKGNYTVSCAALEVLMPDNVGIKMLLKHEKDTFSSYANILYDKLEHAWIPFFLYNIAPGKSSEVELILQNKINESKNFELNAFAYEVTIKEYIKHQLFWAEQYRQSLKKIEDITPDLDTLLLSDYLWWISWEKQLIEQAIISKSEFKSSSIDWDEWDTRGDWDEWDEWFADWYDTWYEVIDYDYRYKEPRYFDYDDWDEENMRLKQPDIRPYVTEALKTLGSIKVKAYTKLGSVIWDFGWFWKYWKYDGGEEEWKEWGEGQIGLFQNMTNCIWRWTTIPQINLSPKDDKKSTQSEGVCVECECIRIAKLLGLTVNSTTPEDKYGPIGSPIAMNDSVSHHYVDTSQVFEYKVDYWNKEDATASAAIVYIRDTIDTDFNLATLNFTEVGFLRWKQPLPGGQYFNVNIDCRPDMPYIVNIEGRVDPDTREVFWVHTTLDTLTMELPEDPLAGYLPPIDSTGYHIGWVNYAIKPNYGLPDGTVFANQAFVNFDGVGKWGPAPKEGPYTNIFDYTPPVSEVLQMKSTCDADSLLIQWTGQDLGSGLDFFTIYVSDGGDFSPWIAYTSDSSAYFYGDEGKTYKLYSIAYDKVGNIEPDKTAYEALVTFSASNTSDTELKTSDIKVYPNPSNCCFTIELDNPDNSTLKIQVVDVLGRNIFNMVNQSVNNLEIDLSQFPKGVYNLKVILNSNEHHQNIILK